jgi:hypothetical protein
MITSQLRQGGVSAVARLDHSFVGEDCVVVDLKAIDAKGVVKTIFGYVLNKDHGSGEVEMQSGWEVVPNSGDHIMIELQTNAGLNAPLMSFAFQMA